MGIAFMGMKAEDPQQCMELHAMFVDAIALGMLNKN